MRLGTKTVLYGTHSPFIHTFFVAWAWKRLYGFPWDPRLWIAFAVHDLGYLGKETIDGPDGKEHPMLGAKIMGCFFGIPWAEFCLYHSRFYARSAGRSTSPLCRADKLAIALTPWWVFVPLARLTGEIYEYMATVNASGFYTGSSHREFFALLQAHHREIAMEEQPPITVHGPEGEE